MNNRKIVIIINGTGGVGKDTICSMVALHYKCLNVSSIDPIKKIAIAAGWNEEKNEKGRKLLSDLKRICTEYNDLPYNYLESYYERFLKDENEVLFVHIREPNEIQRFKKIVRVKVVTLLIKGKEYVQYGNKSDDGVDNYPYDYIYYNTKSLDELEDDFMRFFTNYIWEGAINE